MSCLKTRLQMQLVLGNRENFRLFFFCKYMDVHDYVVV